MDKDLKKYFAISIIFILAISILFMLKNFVVPILTGILLAFLLFPLYRYIKKKIKSETTSAMLVILFVFLVILIPVSALAGVLLNEVKNFSIDEQKLNEYELKVVELTGKDFSIDDNIQKLNTWIRNEFNKSLPNAVSYTSNFLLSVFIMFFVMFYLLVEKEMFIKEFVSFMPFSKKHSSDLLNDSGDIIKAVFIGQVITAVIQGLLGMASFLIVGVEGAFFWGIVMILLSLIPLVGAFLVWLPVGLFLLLEGSTWQGIFVLAWGALVVSQIDNFIRPKLVNKFADIHPLETFLGIFMGIPVFGIIGIIIGPLILSLFKLVVLTYRKEY